MAEGGAQGDSAKYSCPVCQNLLNDPVTIPCGHSYCNNCIDSHWDEEMVLGNVGLYSCPLCRETFWPRPDLKKNIMLAQLVDDLKTSAHEAESDNHCYAGPKDVACDVCTGRKLKAIRSCLDCLASYCEEHLQHHYKSASLKNHKLVDFSKKLQEKICSRHGEVMELFCRTDQQCICYFCTLDQHRGHETVPAATERIEKQKELEMSRVNIQERIQQRKKDVEFLQEQRESINVSADEAVEHSEENFTQVIRLIQKRRDEVHQQLRYQQQTAVSGVKEHQEKLEKEIVELKTKDGQLEQLAHTELFTRFLHSYLSLSALGEPTHNSIIQSTPFRFFQDVAAAVSESKERLQDILTETGRKISQRAMDVELLLPQPQPETRADFLLYAQPINLDPNTAHRRLVLSDSNRKVTITREEQPYSDHPDRFTHDVQVLSREGLTGRCYLEVEQRGRVDVAVAYKSISRSGAHNECVFGCNDKSWILCCVDGRYRFCHNNRQTHISGPRSSRLGVYLDHSAGILSFYSVSETMTLLYRVQTTFTQPLHAGVWLLFGESAEFLRPQ